MRRIILLLLAAPFLLNCSGAQGRAVDGGVVDASDASVGDTAPAACQGVDGGSVAGSPYADMNVTASGFAEHEGQTVFLVTRGSNGRALGAASATVTRGAFAFHFPKGYKRAQDQEVLWLLDADGDGVCDDAGGDHTGYLVVNAVDPGADPLAVAITDNHVRTTPGNENLCNPPMPFGNLLDMNVTASGFDAHEGRTVHLLTRTGTNGAIFGSGDAVVAGGGFALHFSRGYERFSYQEIFFFVDVDGDGTCTPGTDHPGYTVTAGFNPTQNMPDDEPITDNHMTKSGRGADVCVVMNGCPLAP